MVFAREAPLETVAVLSPTRLARESTESTLGVPVRFLDCLGRRVGTGHGTVLGAR